MVRPSVSKLVHKPRKQRVVVIGAGWAGCAAALRACRDGHSVTLLEASCTLGGRARSVEVALPQSDGRMPESITLDNGQHILLGAYRETLTLMQSLGIDLSAALHRIPMRLGILQTEAWSWRDHVSLAKVVTGWIVRGFSCSPSATVADVCASASERVKKDVIEQLCLSALNTPMHEASGRVFLRVLKDAFLSRAWVHASGTYASSDMLIPTIDLSALLPSLVAQALQAEGSCVRLGIRASGLRPVENVPPNPLWEVDLGTAAERFDHVIIATPPWEAARLLRDHAPDWARLVDALEYRAIATVYALAPASYELPKPMLALASSAQRPAQFVFARREAKGLLAFVVSHAQGERSDIERLVLAQGQARLGVTLQALTTITERRATFACKAHITRPAQLSLAGLSVVGDYLAGPYPATIEGAVRSAAAL